MNLNEPACGHFFVASMIGIGRLLIARSKARSAQPRELYPTSPILKNPDPAFPPVEPTHAPPAPEPLPPQVVETLAPFLALSPKNQHAIRPAAEFLATSSDLRGQVLELIDHLFVRYPVPLFLYRPMLSEEGLRLVFPEENRGPMLKSRLAREANQRRWFYAVAWGESLATIAKDCLSKREAHWFLQAPAHNSIETNLRWARVAALGVPPEACDFFLDKFDNALRCVPHERKSDLTRFYARTWLEMRVHEREEIADFLRSTLDDPTFSLAGRTIASVRRLSEGWHRRYGDYAPPRPHLNLGRGVRWRAAFTPWSEDSGASVVQMVELTDSRGLQEEGARQGHCVASYAAECHANRSRIVSFRWFEGAEEVTRLTVEVHVGSRQVVQIRGRRNRRAACEELDVIQRWAGAHGLGVRSYA